MKLLLLRHGEAVDATLPGVAADAARQLTPRGRRQIRRVGRWLAALDEPVDVILTSPLVRARETADTLREHWGTEADTRIVTALRPNSPPAQAWRGVRATLRLFPQAGSILCVGHEPCLGRLAAWLLTGQDEGWLSLKKGGLIRLNLPTPGTPAGNGITLEGLVGPGDLRR